jgi:hypothetical protein
MNTKSIFILLVSLSTIISTTQHHSNKIRLAHRRHTAQRPRLIQPFTTTYPNKDCSFVENVLAGLEMPLSIVLITTCLAWQSTQKNNDLEALESQQ